MLQEQLDRWIHIHSLLIVMGLGLSLILGKGDILALLGFGSFTYLVTSICNLQQHYFLGGPANWVTAFRLIIVFVLLLNFHYLPGLWQSVLAFVVLLLDGVDGWLARRFKLESISGGYFDKETDAYFVMVLSLTLYWQGQAGIWVLGLGLIRYLYVIPLLFYKEKDKPEAKTSYGRIIAGIVFIGLSLALALPQNWNEILLPVLALLLFYSFGRSFLELIGKI